MKPITANILHRLLEKCIAVRDYHVTIVLTEQEKHEIGEIIYELFEQGYIFGFCPKTDILLECDLTEKALQRCDVERGIVL